MSGNTLLALGLLGCAGVVVVALVGSRFLKSEPPPPPPPPPPAAEKTVTGVLRYTEGYYKAQLDDDAKKLGMPAPTPLELSQPLAYADELEAPRKLKPDRDKLETSTLKLTTHTIKEWAMTAGGQGFKFEHVILEITNKTDKPLAYRIETAVPNPDKCKSKGSIPHNAVALAPLETVKRSECLWAPNTWLLVRKIETMPLSELGYQYVSRLPPVQILLDERTAAGHTPPKGAKACAFVPWRDIQVSGQTWGDVVDFYARHNCEVYSVDRGYKRWTAPRSLPWKPADVNAPAPAPPPQAAAPPSK
jgi:hypothetical protein